MANKPFRYKDEGGGGGGYLTRPEKELLAEEGVVFQLITVEFQPEQGYKGSDRFLIVTELEGEQKKISFGVGKGDPTSRDRLLGAVAEYQADGGEDEIFVVGELLPGQGGNPFVNLIRTDRDGNVIEDDTEEEGEEPVARAVKKPVAKAPVKKTTAKTARRK